MNQESPSLPEIFAPSRSLAAIVGTAAVEPARPPEFDWLGMSIDWERENAEYAAYLAGSRRTHSTGGGHAQ
ncbi:MAG: hypothetical protein ACLQNE_35525 [Thermoguttaceae bacterium]